MDELEEGEITDADPTDVNSCSTSEVNFSRGKRKSQYQYHKRSRFRGVAQPTSGKDLLKSNLAKSSHKPHVCKNHQKSPHSDQKHGKSKPSVDAGNHVSSDSSNERNKSNQSNKISKRDISKIESEQTCKPRYFRPNTKPYNNAPSSLEAYGEINMNSSYDDLLQQYKRIQSELSTLQQHSFANMSRVSSKNGVQRSVRHRGNRGKHRSPATEKCSNKNRSFGEWERKVSNKHASSSGTLKCSEGSKPQNKNETEKSDVKGSHQEKPSNSKQSNESSVPSGKDDNCLNEKKEKHLANKENFPSSNISDDNSDSLIDWMDNYEIVDMEVSSNDEKEKGDMLEVPDRIPTKSTKERYEDDEINALREELILSLAKKKLNLKNNMDNYEVLDMEVCSDSDQKIKTVELADSPPSEEIPVIAMGQKNLKPSQNTVPNMKGSLPVVGIKVAGDEDIDALRAELIISMNRNKANLLNKAASNVISPNLIVITTTSNNCDIQNGAQIPVTCPSSTNTAKPKKETAQPLVMSLPNGVAQKSSKELTSFVEVNVKKSNTTYNKSQFQLTKRKEKVLPQHTVYMKQNPLIINLANDSSTDEESSAEDCEVSNAKSNGEADVFASLEKLIETAKKKSNDETSSASPVQVESSNKVTPVLPEAQQKEYSKLKEIIAQRESKLAEIKAAKAAGEKILLKKKLGLALSVNKKYGESLKLLKAQENKKKVTFINSRLAVQRLRERLTAAELVQKQNGQSMFLVKQQIETVEVAISKNTQLIKNLEAEFKKKL